MKQFLILLFVVLFGGLQNVSAQMMVKEGNQWSYYTMSRAYYEKEYELFFSKYEFKESYELNGKTYNRLYYTSSDEYGNIEEPKPVLGLREEDGRVYADYDEFMDNSSFLPDAEKSDMLAMAHTITEDKEVILYDFTLSEGDYFGPTDIFAKTYVKNKTKIQMENGEARDVFEVWRDIDYGWENNYISSVYWESLISGIGSARDLIHWLCMMETTGEHIYHELLNVYVEGNTLVYKAPEYIGDAETENESYTTYKKDPFFGNLVTGIGSVKSDAGHDIKPSLYDLSGRKVEGRPRPGVYIKAGRKVVIK